MLKVEHLTVNYKSIKAVEDVSIEVKEGECVAIIGANGAGKSTLLKTIIGLLKQKSGNIEFEGEEISSLAAHKRAQLGISFVPEGARVFPKITTEGNLLLAVYHEKDKAKIRERLEHVYTLFPRLKERNSQLAGTLSGGERQMLALGRALMSKPKLLMVDEISLGLMPKLVDFVFEILSELHKSGITILLAEQNANKASEIAQRMYVLALGKIEKQAKPEEILSDPEIRKAYLGM
ncbi:ABC transporter ATP-binding protein [Hippea alviniae]|uniref:ABC transporter ATP-binding protein n=1 Tax=Hippea alviniae TaxID=1279027 RepID=UPI0003B65B89|nr:ABC transporter ATP-binding protein [Hippea alviniae]